MVMESCMQSDGLNNVSDTTTTMRQWPLIKKKEMRQIWLEDINDKVFPCLHLWPKSLRQSFLSEPGQLNMKT